MVNDVELDVLEVVIEVDEEVLLVLIEELVDEVVSEVELDVLEVDIEVLVEWLVLVELVVREVLELVE